MTSTSMKLMSFFYTPKTLRKQIQLCYSLRALKCTAAEMMSVSTPPRIYANVRFSIPHIIGEMKTYDAHTYVIINAGIIPIITGFFSRNR